MRVIEPASASEFEQYYKLRWEVLRAPWKQPLGSERDSLESGSIHVMVLVAEHKPAGVGRLHFDTIRAARIRYMAVDSRYRRQGIGSLVLAALEERAQRMGAATIALDARETALGFYNKRGYMPTGPGHTLFNCIAHVKLVKDLRRV
jgi:GNAT superfamily N-acetyltransferase